MKAKSLLIASLAVVGMTFTACDEEPGNPGGTTVENVAGEVSGVWEKNSVVKISGHITVPEGKTLVVEEGVKVIFSSNGVGVSHTPIEFIVDGNLYTQGTKENPVLFSVDESERTESNAFAGLWGGIVATDKCAEMVIDNTIIEYTGGAVLKDSPSAVRGIYEAGEDFDPQITTKNVNGKYVVTNSVLRYGASDAIYMMGGSGIIANNIFAGNGYDGGEAVNVKAGCKVDVAQNIMYSPNTNGLKLSSSGQNDDGGRAQALIRAYNNTIINAGWRRDGVKGGCIYVEKNALVSVFNNMLVNCKFKAMTPSWEIPNNPEEGYADASVIDYNFYVAGSPESTLDQDVADGTTNSYLGYTLENEKYSPNVDLHSLVSASAGDTNTDPKFVNFPYNTNELTGYIYDENWDFHVAADSPALQGAYSGNDEKMQPYFGGGLTVNGKTYSSPAPQAWFGAFGK
jgi:hypothetical protein